MRYSLGIASPGILPNTRLSSSTMAMVGVTFAAHTDPIEEAVIEPPKKPFKEMTGYEYEQYMRALDFGVSLYGEAPTKEIRFLNKSTKRGVGDAASSIPRIQTDKRITRLSPEIRTIRKS